jgi:predicted glycoside hydrolase/deacetylase ChbG (UPF0249 family)
MSGESPRRIVVCVDDFGLTPAASAAAIDLAWRARVSAVSSIVDGPHVDKVAGLLRQSRGECAIGLHLNLTERSACRDSARLTSWMWRSLRARGWYSRVTAEIHRQLDRFEALYGTRPAFVDGHEHVHQLRAVRRPLLDVLASRFGAEVAVRSTVPQHNRGLKATLISRIGGRALRDSSRALKLESNRDFAGVYDFTARIPFEQRMRGWLASIEDRGLIMCHPERPSHRSHGGDVRSLEFEFLSSDRWPALQRELNVRLSPFRAGE